MKGGQKHYHLQEDLSGDKNLYRLPKWTRTYSHYRLGIYLIDVHMLTH
ncbi:hypothetical protein [Paenibacillus gallinarum]|uniref:Uncharacterized protein n=1 Tax=Paenibacillus gallinarum TaxID=2762232 RepID=A0ABR8T636_9BACL|nr:hypothetical protein [Paenibacillus gallinarum]MBD7971223.1 hypothetical protein [Paenibacillus gallinarum]